MAQIDQDQEHLRLLSIFHYVVGGIAGFFACIPLIHVGLGLMLALNPHGFDGGKGNDPPAFLGWFFVIFGGIFILIGWSFAAAIILGGRFIAQRKHYTACVVIAALCCAFFPFGTALGVFSLMVLMRPSVKDLFSSSKSPTPPTA